MSSSKGKGYTLGYGSKNSSGVDPDPEAQLSEMMRKLHTQPDVLRINIANPDEKRNDSVPIAARTWTVAMLRRAYREAIFLKPMNRSLRDWAWWFKYTNVVFYFNKVKLEDNFTLAHYKIRPGSEILAKGLPKVKITIKNEAGQRKTYKFEGNSEMTIEMVKKKYWEVRQAVAPQQWTYKDIVLLDKDHRLFEDNWRLSDYFPGLRNKRGDAFFKCNYRKNGHVYQNGGGQEVAEYPPAEAEQRLENAPDIPWEDEIQF